MSNEKRRPKTFESNPIYINGSQQTVDSLASESYQTYCMLLKAKRKRVLYQTFYTQVCRQFPDDKELVGLLLPSLFELFQNTMFKRKKKKRQSKKKKKADVVSPINCWTRCFRRFMSWRRHS